MAVYEFEKFERGARPEPTRASVTLSARRTLSLNRRAVSVLGSPAHVELLYDKRRKVIGIKPVKEETPDSYPLRQGKGGTVFIIALGAFTRKFEMVIEQSMRFFPDFPRVGTHSPFAGSPLHTGGSRDHPDHP